MPRRSPISPALTRHFVRHIAGVVAILVLFATGCATPPATSPEPPEVAATVDYTFPTPGTGRPLEPGTIASPTKGTPSEAPSEPSPSADSHRGLPVRVTVAADRPFDPSDASVKPVAAVSRTISNPLREAEVLLVPRLTEGARVRTGELPTGSTLAQSSLVVGAAWTAAVELALTERPDLPVRAVRVELQPVPDDVGADGNSSDTVRVTFTFEGIDGERERVAVIEPVSAEAGAVFRFPRARLAIGIASEDDAPQRDESWAQLESRATEMRSKATKEPRVIPDPVLEALRWRATRREAILRWADRDGAHLTLELGIIASDPTIDAISDHIRAERIANPPPTKSVPAQDVLTPSPEFGLLLEKATLVVSADQIDTLPPEVEAILVAFGGAVGRHSVALENLAREANSLTDLDRRLIDANRRALRDPDASDRVRAYDWLRGRDLAPADYDPLGTTETRRAALRADRAARRAAAAATKGTTP